MKKLDLHIHTVATQSDAPFSFDLSVLQQYISNLSLDCIAITNHNVFDQSQFENIRNNLSIPVFPGIEINLEKGHLLLIAPPGEITEFTMQCEKITKIVDNPNVFLSVDQLKSIFPTLNRYLLIPHYDKDPAIPLEKLSSIRDNIICGEVNSIKKFEYCRKSSEELAPVYFSDIRINKDLIQFPSRYTYFDINKISISTLKTALLDKTKITLSKADGHDLVQILSNGLNISTGLTVILGERSSGKTHTLDAIAKNVGKPKYIKQFSLLSASDEEDEKKFEETLRNRRDTASEEYLKPFKSVIDSVKDILLSANDTNLQRYLDAVLKAGAEANKEDIYSKSKLFGETQFNDRDLSTLCELIKSVELLITNTEYKELINLFVSQSVLMKLAISLMKKYIQEQAVIFKKRYLNDLIKTIKSELQVKTAVTPISEFDFYGYLMDKVKVKKFNEIATSLKRNCIIQRRDIHKFQVVAEVRPFSGAQELKSFSKRVIAFSSAFSCYSHPYEYLCELLSLSDLPISDIYKYFAFVEYRVLNQYKIKASGGERSEFNLLEQLTDATQFDMLLLDEPESSFDNLFLKNDVNKMLKELSKIVPVVIATHNNTVGASVKPDYIIYTQQKISAEGSIQHLTFSGYPSDKELTELNGNTISKHNVLLDCLEAGENAYTERRRTYEMYDN